MDDQTDDYGVTTMRSLILLIVVLLVPGCVVTRVKHPDSGFEAEQIRFLWTTKIGELEATDGTRTLKIKNLSSESQALDLAKTAVEAAKAVRP